MSNPDRIEEGDLVTVVMPTEPAITGVVTHRPSATGDCWCIKTNKGPVNIMVFESMHMLKKSETDVPF